MIMKKTLLIITLMALPLFSFAQVVDKSVVEQPAVEQQCYMYNIVTFLGGMNNEGFDVDLDDGKRIKTLKGKDGKKVKFRTPAAALMYFISEGWELYVEGVTVNPNDSRTTYWIMRKPCSKAEFDRAVEEGVK
jgi:hypothetical protein